MLRVSRHVAAVDDPPVSEAKRWIAARAFDPALPLLDVSQAVPGYPPARELRDFLAEFVLRDDAANYAPVLGLTPARRAVAAHLSAAYNAAVDEHDVMITAGCNQAFCLAIGALCEPGDEVILPVPFYFNHDMWLRACGITTVPVPTVPSDGMLPDVDTIASAVTDRTRAIVLVTPNNPCGVVYPPALIEACCALAASRGIALVVDETYKDFRDTTAPPHALFAHSHWRDTLVHLFSFSKVLSIPGYRAGSLVAAPHVLREAAKLADCETIGAPRIAQEAVAFGLEHLGAWCESRRLDMGARVARVRAALGATDSGFQLVSAGAFFAYVRHPFPDESAAVVARRLVDQHNVLTIPASAFGAGQERFLRLAFGNIDVTEIDELAARLRSHG